MKKLTLFFALFLFTTLYSQPIIDGALNDSQYSLIAKNTSGRAGFGTLNELGAIYYYSDGDTLYLGITGQIDGDNNIVVFLNFSGYAGRNGVLMGEHSSSAGVFSTNTQKSVYGLDQAKLDMEADYALAFHEFNMTKQFYCDACAYDTSGIKNSASAVVVSRQDGETASDGGTLSGVFGGSQNATFELAYKNDFATDSLHGIEMKLPLSVFDGVDNTQTFQLFVVITTKSGGFSNVCIPGDLGPQNLWNDPDLTEITGQDFFTQPNPLTEVQNDVPKPSISFTLYQNYPNPFNPATIIKYSIPALFGGKQNNSPLRVTLKIYDVLGREIRTLVNRAQKPGKYSVQFNASYLPSGVYFYRLTNGKISITKKMTILK